MDKKFKGVYTVVFTAFDEKVLWIASIAAFDSFQWVDCKVHGIIPALTGSSPSDTPGLKRLSPHP